MPAAQPLAHHCLAQLEQGKRQLKAAHSEVSFGRGHRNTIGRSACPHQSMLLADDQLADMVLDLVDGSS